MDMMAIRRRVMLAKKPKIIYEGRNIVFDGTNFVDTGFDPYSEKNIDKDFQIVISIDDVPDQTNLNSIVNAMLEISPYPGFTLRVRSAASFLEVAGAINKYLILASFKDFRQYYLGKEIIIQRFGKENKVSLYLDGIKKGQTELATRTVFDNHLLLGCSEHLVNNTLTKWRFFKGTIGYIRIEYMNESYENT